MIRPHPGVLIPKAKRAFVAGVHNHVSISQKMLQTNHGLTVTSVRSSGCLRFLHIGDNLVRQVLETTSVDGVFELVNSHTVLSPSLVAATFSSLDRLITNHVLTLPWAIHNRSIMLRIQCFANSETKEIFQPVLHCPEFSRLCGEALKHQFQFSAQELVSVTQNLLRLHVDVSSDVFRHLLLECQQQYGQFDLKTLVLYSEVANLLKRAGFHLSSQIAQVVQKRWEAIDLNEENFVSLAKILYSTGYFFTKDALFQFQRKLYEMLLMYRDVTHPGTVLEILEPMSRFACALEPQIIALAVDILEERMDELDLWYLSRAAIFARVQQLASTSFHSRLCEKAVSLLSVRNLRAADIVSLITIHNALNYPEDSTRNLEVLLRSCIGDLDVILLKFVSQSLLISNTTNPELVLAFCERVHHKMNDLAESVSCLLSVTRCLSKSRLRPPGFDRMFGRFLMHHLLDQQIGTHLRHVAVFGRYLVQCVDKLDFRSVQLFTKKLIRILPNFTLLNVATISLGMSVGRNTHPHTEELMNSIAREVLIRVDEISHISLVNLFVKNVFSRLRGVYRDAIICDLGDLYMAHIDTMDLSTVIPTATLLKELKLHLPEVCEHLVKIIVGNSSVVTLPHVAHTLELLAQTNYQTVSLSALQEIAVKKISELDNWQANVIHILRVASSLAVFQVFPEELIRRIFSLKFLKDFDTVMIQSRFKRKHSKHMENLLAELNRSVVLQCPEYDITWFCSQYCESPETKLESNAVKKWRNASYVSLIDHLGGKEFVKIGPLQTAYCHSYDFECSLDKNGSPVPMNSQEVHQRVAVLLTLPHDFCANCHRLLGSVNSKLTQLEILGFKVVEVPYFHLDSMLLTDPKSRHKYFQNKVSK